jgi:ATP-dependent Clp protease ATP-binding subunit ClpA
MRTVFFARYEASSAGSAYVEPRHVVLGLLREAKPLFGLWSLDTRSIRTEIESAFPPQANWDTALLRSSAAVERIWAYAAEEAHGMGAFHIGTGHLLLGILREENAPRAATILHDRGLRLPAVRRKIADGFQESGD